MSKEERTGILEYSEIISFSKGELIVAEDDIIRGLREIVGNEWATNDPVMITAYRNSIIIQEAGLDFYVVMPETTEEVSKIVKFANKNNVPYMARSGGTLLSFAIAPS